MLENFHFTVCLLHSPVDYYYFIGVERKMETVVKIREQESLVINDPKHANLVVEIKKVLFFS